MYISEEVNLKFFCYVEVQYAVPLKTEKADLKKIMMTTAKAREK